MAEKEMPEMEDDEDSGSKKMELEITVYGKGPKNGGESEDDMAKGGLIKKVSGKKSGKGMESGMKKFSPIARPQKFSGLY